MKFVTLVVAAMIFSFGASAQTTHRKDESAVAHKQQKTRSGKVKPSRTKPSAAATNEVVTLTDEKAHKAAWSFEEMLQRRLEIDAADKAMLQGRE